MTIPHLQFKIACFLLALSWAVPVFPSTPELVLSQPLTLRWVYGSERTTNFTPATDAKSIYLPLSDGTLVALNASDGKLLWKTDAGGTFSAAPTADETDVSRTTRVRVQFSRGLREATLASQVRVSYVGDSPGAPIATKATYDPAARSLTITFATPLEAYRTVKVELLDGIRGFDDGPFKPWSVTFSVGGQ